MPALDLRRGGARGGGGSASHVGADAGCSATPASSRGYKTSAPQRGGAAAAPRSAQPPAAGARRPPPQRRQPPVPRPAKTLALLRPPPAALRSAPAAPGSSRPRLGRGSGRATALWLGPEDGAGGAFMRPPHPAPLHRPRPRAPRAQCQPQQGAQLWKSRGAPRGGSARPAPPRPAGASQSDISWRV